MGRRPPESGLIGGLPVPWPVGQDRLACGHTGQGDRRSPGLLRGYSATLRGHTLDAIVAPSGGPAWLIDHICGDHYGGGSSSPAAVAGYPSVTVPAGFVWGLPVGISFIGPAWSETVLIGYAYAFEQATQVRRPPTFAITVNPIM